MRAPAWGTPAGGGCFVVGGGASGSSPTVFASGSGRGSRRFGSRVRLRGRNCPVGRTGGTGQQDGPLGPVQPPLRCLLCARAADLLEGVRVGVVDRDVSVVVDVGPAGADAFDERTGEHRPAGDVLARQWLALEGVLRPTGRREDHASPAFPDEPLADAQVVVPFGSLRERSTEAAVQDHHLAARAAVLELVEQPMRLDAGGRQPVLEGVACREVQAASWVHEAVAGQVDEQQVVGAPVGQEVLDGQADLLGLLVDHRCDREAADVRVGQQVAQLRGVARWGTQPPQGRVDVIRDRDHQRQATAFGDGARSGLRAG